MARSTRVLQSVRYRRSSLGDQSSARWSGSSIEWSLPELEQSGSHGRRRGHFRLLSVPPAEMVGAAQAADAGAHGRR